MDRPRPDRLVKHDAALSPLLTDLLAEIPPPLPADVDSAQDGKTAVAVNASMPSTEMGQTKPEQVPPAWAATRFRALAFRVGEVHFAVPLLALHSVTRLEQPPAAVPGRLWTGIWA